MSEELQYIEMDHINITVCCLGFVSLIGFPFLCSQGTIVNQASIDTLSPSYISINYSHLITV